MTTVIATGCPHSNWESALPILQLAGLEPAGDAYSQWYDDLFRPVSMIDPPTPDFPMPLVPKNGGGVAKLLPEAPTKPLLLAESRNLWLLDFWAAKLPQAQFLLFYTSAEAAVANACLKGIDPLQFLEGWQVANRQLLRFQRCHRGQALLLDAEAASRQPQEMIDICRQIGLPLRAPSELPPSKNHNAVMERLLAGYLIADRPDVQELQKELEATAQPLADNMPAIQLQPLELFSSYFKRKASERNLRQALIGNEQKLENAERVQQGQAAKIDELKDVLGEQINQTTDFKAQIEQLQHEITERNSATVSLQKELSSRQEEISRLQWYLGERDAEIVRLKEMASASEDAIKRLQSSDLERQENFERQENEYRFEINNLKDAFAQKTEETVSLNRLLSERDAALREIELLWKCAMRKCILLLPIGRNNLTKNIRWLLIFRFSSNRCQRLKTN